jgi:hypothetical protein
MISKRCIPLKSTLGGNAVIPWEDEGILFCEAEFSVVFYLLTAVHKFHLKVFIN